MYDYQQIKQIAKDNKVKVTDILALAPRNDPFYTGSEAQRRDAEWIGEIYQTLDLTGKVHIRRIHYILVSRDDISKPDGKPYENTERDWGMLTDACKFARYLGLIPIQDFVDRRNPDPNINAKYFPEYSVSIKTRISIEDIADDIAMETSTYREENAQRYLLELWCEKSTMNDVLLPIARKYNANVVTGLGELSITAVRELVSRIGQANRPARIFYISDFDPAGENMPVSVARKIEYFARKYDYLPEIKLRQVMLTKDQCIEYELPRTPIKDSDLRKAGFEDRHGAGATELDALEALHPGQMAGIISDALDPYFDREAQEAIEEENERLEREVRDAVIKRLKDIKLDGVLKGLDEEIDTDFDYPEVEMVDDDDSDWLLDTRRDYLDQMRRYKKQKDAEFELVTQETLF